MLTEARAEYPWLAAGAQNVQQQALRDFSQAMRNFYAGTHAYPGRRKRCRNEGFRITGLTIHLHVRRLNRRERARLRKAERRKARAPKGSPEQDAERTRVARLRAHEADRRKDWCEKISTGLARRFDLIRFEDLRIKNMTRSAKGTVSNPGSNVKAKSALNRAILAQGWGLLVRRTQDNIAAGHAGGTPVGVREPQLVAS